MADVCVDSLSGNGNIFKRDFAFDSVCNFDSLYCGDSVSQNGTHTKPPISDTAFSRTSEAPGCTTPYKNIDVMMMYSKNISAVDSLHSEKQKHPHTDSNKAKKYKALPPLPTFYLYHPKNCPLHRGAPPRLSPIGALSPPQRSGSPSSGTAGSCLNSPLFPRSHTLPALAAPLYYPNLYPPIPPSAPPLPPKLYQAPLQSDVASKISLCLLSHYILHPFSHCLTSCLHALYISLSCYSLLWIWWPSPFCHVFNLKDLQTWRSRVSVAVLCIRTKHSAWHLIHLIENVISNLQKAFGRVTAVPVRGWLEHLSSLSVLFYLSCLSTCFVLHDVLKRTCISCQAQLM